MRESFGVGLFFGILSGAGFAALVAGSVAYSSGKQDGAQDGFVRGAKYVLDLAAPCPGPKDIVAIEETIWVCVGDSWRQVKP